MSSGLLRTSKRELQCAKQFAVPVTVLFVSPSDGDWVRFSQIIQHTNWLLYRAKEYAEAAEILRARAVAVVVTAEELSGHRTWLDCLELTESCGQPRLIVAAEGGDISLWAQVLNLGGYDVLPKPFANEEVIRVISLAWRNWKDELQRGITGPAAAH